MSSRQEEKERRRQERMAREQAEKAGAARRKRLQLVFGALLAVLIVFGGGALALGFLGGDDNGGGGGGGVGQPKTSTSNGASIPAAKQADLTKAAAAAGCKVVDAPIEGATHEDKEFKASDYKTNPPTSGNHNPVYYPDGIFAPGNVPELGKLVHPLEHGRIEIQYKPGTPQATVDRLEALVNDISGGYHILMFENTTGMTAQVAATAWGHSVTCPTMNDNVFDAIRDFHTKWVDKGPEVVA